MIKWIVAFFITVNVILFTLSKTDESIYDPSDKE